MFDLLFGKENTEKILKYFENDYFEMSLQIMPFVYDVVEPALKNYVLSKKALIAENYNMSKRQKRKIGL